MDSKPNNSVMLQVTEELEKAVFRSRKSIRVIINSIATSYPEITLPDEEWTQLDKKTRNAIIQRVLKSISSFK